MPPLAMLHCVLLVAPALKCRIRTGCLLEQSLATLRKTARLRWRGLYLRWAFLAEYGGGAGTAIGL